MARNIDLSILDGLKGRSILRLTDLSAAEITALLETVA